jgi:hypothetical protein
MHRCNATFYGFYGVKNDMPDDQKIGDSPADYPEIIKDGAK